MDIEKLKMLLEAVSAQHKSVDEAADELKHLACENIEFAHIDHHRSLRKGFPEVIFGQGKTATQISQIMLKMIRQENVVLATRVDKEKAQAVQSQVADLEYHSDARMLIWRSAKRIEPLGRGMILVLSAGTSDIPVAREAALTAEAMGNEVKTIFDVGVAGIHRLMQYQPLIQQATVLIVVAGMEGALPSVVAGLVDRPVIAVPTSIGYGVSLGGITALFSMLNACASNVAAVNIDNGFGAGYMAAMINRP